jgi:hypothetical protein
LRARGLVAAWQLCALCLGEAPNVLTDAEIELALLGEDHRQNGVDVRQRRGYLAPGCIYLTEMFEYARVVSAGRQLPLLLPGFHLHKLYLAQALAEVGKLTEAYAYCEAVAWALDQLDVDQLRQLRVAPLFLTQLQDLAMHLLAKSPTAADQCSMNEFWESQVRVKGSCGPFFYS